MWITYEALPIIVVSVEDRGIQKIIASLFNLSTHLRWLITNSTPPILLVLHIGLVKTNKNLLLLKSYWCWLTRSQYTSHLLVLWLRTSLPPQVNCSTNLSPRKLSLHSLPISRICFSINQFCWNGWESSKCSCVFGCWCNPIDRGRSFYEFFAFCYFSRGKCVADPYREQQPTVPLFSATVPSTAQMELAALVETSTRTSDAENLARVAPITYIIRLKKVHIII